MNKFRLLPLALLILVFTVTAYADRDAEIRDSLKIEFFAVRGVIRMIDND